MKRGIHRLAVAVDHVIPLSKGGDYRRSNLQPLCQDCHDDKTAKDRGVTRHRRQATGVDGWPIED